MTFEWNFVGRPVEISKKCAAAIFSLSHVRWATVPCTMRCSKHGLAASPDGTCVVCRRATAPQRATGLRWLGWLAGASVVLLLGFALVRWGVRSLEPARAEPPPRTDPALVARPAWTTVPSASMTTAPPAHTTAFEATTAFAVDDHARLEEERKRVSITVYTTSWCPHCREAKSWLKSHDQPYFERDIEQDPTANAAMRALNPSGGVPTLHVDSEVIVGFSDAALERAIDNAAKRRIASAHN